MYNRYIPDANGIYSRQSIPEPRKQPEKPAPAPCQSEPVPEPKQPICSAAVSKAAKPSGFDTGDLLLLCIILLLLIDSEEDDIMTILITAAAFLFLQ